MSWSKAILVTVILAIIMFLAIHDLETLAINRNLLESLKDLRGRYESLLTEHWRLLGEHADLREKYKILEVRFTELSASHEALARNHTALESEYRRVLAAYIESAAAYASLNETYWELRAEYEAFKKGASGYIELKNAYEELLDSYQNLYANYGRIKAEYDKLYAAVYRPLPNVETPSLRELKDWLAEDDTDMIPYQHYNFTCGDFAVMLHIRAKLRNWDMGIVLVIGRLSDDSKFIHAFNVIRCKEGVVYIEPQNDQIFNKISKIYAHPGFGTIYADDIIIVVPYQKT